MSVQPAETPDVELVVGFLNTLDIDEGTDLLASFDSWRRWTAERGLRPGALPSANQARDALRAAVGDPRLNTVGARATVRIELSPGGPVLTPDNAVGAVLAAAARLAVLGEWARIKICPADTCLWAFYDHSRNRSRSWCSMRTCGNREKARVWRDRNSPAGHNRGQLGDE